MALFGLDMGNLTDAIGGAVKAMGAAMGDGDFGQRRDPLARAPQGQARDPFAGLSYGGARGIDGFQTQPRDPFGGLRYEGDPLRGFQSGQPRDPLGGFQLGQRDPLGGFESQPRNNFGSFESALQNQSFAESLRAEERRQKELAEIRSRTQTGPLTPTGGQYDFSGPATAEDNQGLTGAQIDQFVRGKFANSPLVGTGDALLQIANKYGVSALLILGIAWKESGMGTNVGAGNIFGITDPSRDGGLGGQRAFQSYNGALAEIEAAAQNLATNTYKGKSAAEQIGAWYVGPDEYDRLGLSATDRAGNGTVGEYLNNFIAPTYAAFGKAFNPAQAPRPAATRNGGAAGVAGGMASIWGGVEAPVTQAYGVVTPGIDQSIYGYGRELGGPGGHTGLDIGLPRGSTLYMPQGSTGTVITAGGTPYFLDEDYGDQGTPGKGELRVRLSNGDEIIFGHTGGINVGVGQQVTGGMAIGSVGSANGDHLHLEVRVRQPDGSYRLVNPAEYFGYNGPIGQGDDH